LFAIESVTQADSGGALYPFWRLSRPIVPNASTQSLATNWASSCTEKGQGSNKVAGGRFPNNTQIALPLNLQGIFFVLIVCSEVFNLITVHIKRKWSRKNSTKNGDSRWKNLLKIKSRLFREMFSLKTKQKKVWQESLYRYILKWALRVGLRISRIEVIKAFSFNKQTGDKADFSEAFLISTTGNTYNWGRLQWALGQRVKNLLTNLQEKQSIPTCTVLFRIRIPLVNNLFLLFWEWDSDWWKTFSCNETI